MSSPSAAGDIAIPVAIDTGFSLGVGTGFPKKSADLDAVLTPSPIHELYDGLVHLERRRIPLLPGGIDPHDAAIDRAGADESLVRKEHIPSGIKAGKDPPLEIFVVIQSHIRTHGDYETHSQGRSNQILKDLS